MNAQNQDRHGQLEQVNGKWLVWKAGTGGGYLGKNGGFTTKMKNAARFDGPGEAIRTAASVGFAILSW